MTPPGASRDSHGRIGVRHGDHVDYLDHGRLLHEKSGRIEEHRIEVSERNPDTCDPARRVKAEAGHVHGPNCGHEAVPHGDHIDYLVDNRLQHPHGDHIDDHGPLSLA
ncbi:MAG TPA: hypothetical protein VGH03_11385 [Caulobacteraceae bacterium]|jgi:hypothetical protein